MVGLSERTVSQAPGPAEWWLAGAMGGTLQLGVLGWPLLPGPPRTTGTHPTPALHRAASRALTSGSTRQEVLWENGMVPPDS